MHVHNSSVDRLVLRLHLLKLNRNIPAPDRTSVAVPGNEKVKKTKLDVCENWAPSPLIFTHTSPSQRHPGFFRSYMYM